MAPNRGTPAVAPRTGGLTVAFDEVESREHASINEDVEFMLERLRQSGFAQVVAVDITRSEIGIPVVRVVVPRAETWSFFFLHTGRARVGSRALEQIHAGR